MARKLSSAKTRSWSRVGMRTGPVQQRLHLRLVQGIAQGTLLSRAERPRDGFCGGLPALIAPSFDDITKPWVKPNKRRKSLLRSTALRFCALEPNSAGH